MKELFAQVVMSEGALQVMATATLAGVGWTLRKLYTLAVDVARIKEHLKLK